ncbi:RraA family protein [Novosphingobium sp.]|uniref:RraA family protein n=1 Tax=Novosphingobium sp. TaxID=1874826 RepID=UPI003566ABFC
MEASDDITRSNLHALTTAALSDALAGVGVLAPGFIRYSGTGVVAGRAVTADCAEGSLLPIFEAIESAKQGDFLCIRGPGDTAYLGELLAANIVNRGLSGAVIDGLARDRNQISTMPATFVAKGLTPVNLRRQIPGRAMQQVALGGVDVMPGDWVVVDDDGIIAIPPDEVEGAIGRARQAGLIEQRIRQLILERGMPVPQAVKLALTESRDPTA